MLAGLLWLGAWGCEDRGPYARAYQITHRSQTIGGVAALAELGDYIVENDKIRLAISQRGNSVGAGMYGGTLLDADVQRPQAVYRGGRGKDQLSELFPLANLIVPAVCEPDEDKLESYCAGGGATVTILCDGVLPCDMPGRRGEAYDFPGVERPSSQAAVIRVEGPGGQYLEALGLVKILGVKMDWNFKHDYVLEPGASFVRMRTMFSAPSSGGELVALPPLTGKSALFGMLLGSEMYETDPDLPDVEPGVVGGDFAFFGERLGNFGPGTGFDILKGIRNRAAVGGDPLNDPVLFDFMAGVGENVSYALASADADGKFLLPLYTGSINVGLTHGAHCYPDECPGCANVIDCDNVRGYVYERIFAVGDGDVASATAPIYERWGTPTGRVSGHVYDSYAGQPVSGADVHVYPVPLSMGDCRPERPEEAELPYDLGAEGFEEACLKNRHFLGAVNHFRTDRRATDLPEGAFGGVLPVGNYYLLAKKLYRPASQVVEVQVNAGTTSEVNLHLRPPATIRYEVRDETGRRIPAKLSVGHCFPNCSGRLTEACQGDDDCASGKCVEQQGERLCLIDNCPADRACDLSVGRCMKRQACTTQDDCSVTERCESDHSRSASRCVCLVSHQRQAALGEGNYPPGLGLYKYTADGFGELEIEPGAYDVWASRGVEYSVDKKQVALVPGQSATLTFGLVREVDTAGWISGDFHVHGQNSYDADVRHRDRVIAFAGEGVEMLSTSDHDYITDLAPYVHELGLETWLTTQVGLELTTVETLHFLGFPYRYQEWVDGERLREQGAPDWTGKYPDQIFDDMRDLGLYSPDETVILIAHPRDTLFGYFYQYGLSAYNMQAEGSFLEWVPGINTNPIADPAAFSGRFDAMEIFLTKRFEVIRTPAVGELRDYNLAVDAIQRQADSGASPDWIERQIIEMDRRFIKDMLRRSPAEQDAIWDASGDEGCDLFTFCTSNEDCTDGQVCDSQETSSCYLPCSSAADCAAGRDCLEGKCEPDMAPDLSPCTSYEGVVDDFFRMLDYGVVRTAMANSDTHMLFSTEAGIPHSFVRLSAEQPKGVDKREMARNIIEGKVTASYGPFLELWVGEQEVGGTYQVPTGTATVPVRIRVQSASWFDIDRVEVYRSGRLVHVFTAAGDELDPQSNVDVSGLRLPNPGIVNLDCSLSEPVPEKDAWYVVIAMGIDGRDLTPVYKEHPYRGLEVADILANALAGLPLSLDFGSTRVPRVFRVYPYAITNPVFVDLDGDIDGDGMLYEAPNPIPEWADGSSLRSNRSPLRTLRR
jgi:hypothetical protein